MALIKCPECGHEISNKAKKCVHCGRALKNGITLKRFCSECGKEVSINALECSYCGYPLKDEQIDVKTSNVSKVPLVFAIIYVIFLLIYVGDIGWNIPMEIMFIMGIALMILILLGKKIERKIQKFVFLAFYIIGAFIIIFKQNMAYISSNAVMKNFFGSYIYNDSFGAFLAVIQIIAVVAIIMLCICMFVPKSFPKFAAFLLFVSAILGMIYNICMKIYREDIIFEEWGISMHCTFYIWWGIVMCSFFMMGATYLLIYEKKS